MNMRENQEWICKYLAIVDDLVKQRCVLGKSVLKMENQREILQEGKVK